MKDLISQTRLVAAQRRAARRLQDFGRSEDGAIVAYTLFVLLLMLAAGGIAVDVMRQEMERAHLQNTADTAVLAAAGAPYGSDQKAIVEDYFAKAGLSSYLHAIDDDGLNDDDDIITTLNASKVSISASRSLDTYLMKLSGVDTLTANAASSAERRIPKLEVVMVLDVSGSMRHNSKLSNLKTAGKKFVSTILNGSKTGDSVIAIVPFSWSVTPTAAMFEALAVREAHNYSTCLRFQDNDFNHASLATGNSGFSEGNTIDQMIYTSVYGSFDNHNNSWRSCFTDEYMQIQPFSFSETTLHSKIDSFQADGNTSGHQGMNWGAAMLDPTFRQITPNLIAANEMDSSLTSIPSNYNEAETLKIIVMMGDGQNTTSYFFDNNPYRGRHSDLYEVVYQDREFKYAYHIYKHNKSNDESKCRKNKWECVYEAAGPAQSVYYLHDRDDARYYSIDEEEWINESEFDDLPNSMPGFISKEQLTWEMAWGLMSPEYYNTITGNSGPWNDYVGSGSLNGSAKDTRMLNVCTATKNQNVVVYTIGFEISQGGTAETVLRNCASSPAHYYRAEGININDAFSSIASNVVNLRLTQ